MASSSYTNHDLTAYCVNICNGQLNCQCVVADDGKVILPSSPAFGRGIQNNALPEAGFVHMKTPLSGTFHFYTAEGILQIMQFESLPFLRELIQDYANARRFVLRPREAIA